MRVMTAVAFSLLGCVVSSGGASQGTGPERFTKLNESPRPMSARAPASVQIYQVKPPEEPFVEVYQLADLGSNENEALELLRLSSARFGCDGLIVGPSRVESASYSGRNQAGLAGPSSASSAGYSRVDQISLAGTCIMFVQDPQTWRAPDPDSPSLGERQRDLTPQQIEVCARGRERIFATKDPRKRAQVAGELPPECHR